MLKQAPSWKSSDMNRGHSVGIAWVGLAAVFFCSQAFGQKPEFDFFPDFRNVFTVKVRTHNPSITNDGILEEYASSLKSEGVTETEIARRIALIRSQRLSHGNDQRAHSGNRTGLRNGRGSKLHLPFTTGLEGFRF